MAFFTNTTHPGLSMKAALWRAAFVLLAAGFPGTSAPASPAPDSIPAFRHGSRILFQGDSITDGNRGRSDDPNHILGHGYVFVIAARYGAAFPELGLDFMNRGTSGNGVADLAARWQADCLGLHPDIVSILVGVNDNLFKLPVADFERDYDALLARTVAADPKVKLVLCTPFSLPVGARKVDFATWYAGIRARQDIVERLAAKYHAALVRLQPVFDEACRCAPAEHWIWDGVHPTYSGHELIADEWIRVVRLYWPES